MTAKKLLIVVLVTAMLAVFGGAVSAQEELSLWYHGAGNER
jgi:hypothetical protein